MKNSKALFQETVSTINISESTEEVQAIAYILFESVWGISREEIMAEKMIPDMNESIEKLRGMVQGVNRHKPVQYVVGEAYFFGRKFQVNPAVLIPRPETEELISVVLAYKDLINQSNTTHPDLRILDIGTGSGCIPVTLFLEIQHAEVYATDISNAALTVATYNAENHQAKVSLIEHNILRDEIPVQNLDVIVSNPPYVTQKEMGNMARNVVDHEPHLALFVSDDDPLVFYKAIVQQSLEALKVNGLLVVEINERFGNEVSQLFLQAGYKEISILKDLDGKDRVVRGINQ